MFVVQELVNICHVLTGTEVHKHAHKSPPFEPILRHLKPVHISIPSSLNAHFNIILSSPLWFFISPIVMTGTG